jgi:hypothetical protein
VQVRADVEDRLQVISSDFTRFTLEIEDGSVSISGPSNRPLARLEPSIDEFIATAESDKAAVRSMYEIADTSVIDSPGGPWLRKVYFTVPLLPTATSLVYVDEYPLEFGGIWGRYRIVDAARASVSVDWDNKGDVIFAMLMLGVFGPFVAVTGSWWLRQRYPVMLERRRRAAT